MGWAGCSRLEVPSQMGFAGDVGCMLRESLQKKGLKEGAAESD